MKTFKYFLALPLALSAITACGGSSFKTISYEDAVKIADNYVTSVANSKASAIEVSGHINTIKLNGNMTWWSLSSEEDISMSQGLFSMIPNFELEDAEVVVDSQDIAKFTIPGSLTSIAENAFNVKKKITFMTFFINDLPKFPMNSRLLKMLNGFDAIKMKEGTENTVDWDAIDYKKWEKATVSYGSAGGRLKVALESEDMLGFIDEVMGRVSGEPVPPSPEAKVFPGSISITTNNIGYIDSLSLNFKFEDVEEETPYEDTSLFYLYVGGDLEVDLSLNFKQTVSTPTAIKYQLCEYGAPDADHPAAVTYGGESLALYDTVPLTSNLDDLKEYVTFDWHTNYDSDNSQITVNYDDPLFEINYWRGENCGKNVAFTAENYDVIAIPKYKFTEDKTAIVPEYKILGADANGVTSLVSTSSDGRLVSTDEFFPDSPGRKILTPAGDSLREIEGIQIGEEMVPTSGNFFGDEIFINQNMIKDDGTEYVVSIAVMKCEQ